MGRETMAWYKCDVCGRRGLFYECRWGARKVHVCPYCLIALSGIVPLRCGREAREFLENLRRQAIGGREDLAERVREKLVEKG